MAYNDIAQKIIDDAELAAREALTAAREKAEEVGRASRERISRREDEAMAAARLQARQDRERAVRMARLDVRKEDLAVKRALVELAFERALDMLRSASDEQKTALFSTLLARNASGGEALSTCREERRLFTQPLLSKYGVTLSDADIDCAGGFVLAKGGVDVNCTYEIMLDSVRADMEGEAARMIFGGEGA